MDILIILTAVLFIFGTFLYGKLTKPILYPILVSSLLLILKFSFESIHKEILPSVFVKSSIWLFLLHLIISGSLISLYLFIGRRREYNFNHKIISLSYILYSLMPIKIKPNTRIIGRVFPYNFSQLVFNNKMIISNKLADAGGMLITGSTGSGKTYSLLSLMKQNIENGNSIIYCEYKGDPEVVEELSDYGKSCDYDVYILDSDSCNFNYDPLLNLNNTGRIEAVMNMRKWSLDGSDAHYKSSTMVLLQKTIKDFSHAWEYGNLNKESFTRQYFDFLRSYKPATSEWDSYTTITKLLELLLTSSLEPMFYGKLKETLNFNKMKNDKFLIIVSFLSSNKELATSFTSLLLRDLQDEFTRKRASKNIYLYADEFGTLENPFIIKDCIEKGRSAGICSTLALLDVNQIVIQTNEAYLFSLLGTLNTFMIYPGAHRDAAIKLAGTQIADIENVLMNLRKPDGKRGPTAVFISKYPTINKERNSEVYRFEPFIYKKKIDKCRVQPIIKNTASEVKEPESINAYNKDNQDNQKLEIKEVQKPNFEKFLD